MPMKTDENSNHNANSTATANGTQQPSRRKSNKGNLNNDTNKGNEFQNNTLRQIWVARTLFVTCLCAVAAVLGFLAHYYLSRAENELAETQYASIADRALTEAATFANQKRWSTITMASMVSEMLPNASQWPFVTVRGFERIVNHMLNTSVATEMGFVPLVKPGQELEEWEEFIYDFYENTRSPPFPNGTAVNSFGKGVFGVDPSLGTSDNRYRDDGLTTRYGSPYQVLFPVTHVKEGADRVLLFNLHSVPDYGRAIDNMLDCWNEHNKTQNSSTTGEYNCGSITTMLDFLVKIETRGPTAIVYQPIFPADDPTMLAGMIISPIIWDQILYNSFAKTTSGIDCVLETDQGQFFTYRVHDGVATPNGKGDLHQPQYNDSRRSIQVTASHLYTDTSPVYTLNLYCSDEFLLVYHTSNAIVATVGVVSVILITSMLFFLYDFLVRREDLAKKELLTAKRNFIRFISHEVRTPLNSVSMGLSVLQNEIAGALGYRSADPLREILATSSGDDHGNVKLPPATNKEEGADASMMQQQQLYWFGLAEELLENSQIAVDVLSDLLNYDKIESGSLVLSISLIPIFRVIEKTVSEFKLAATKRKVDFQLTFNDSSNSSSGSSALPGNDQEMQGSRSSAASLPKHVRVCKVVGDELKIAQVLRNLISNSLKFTPEGGSLDVAVRCDFSTASVDDTQEIKLEKGDKVLVFGQGQLEVSVTDTGAGLSEAQLSQLFQEGMQFNASSLQGGNGSGFGLWISKGIVKMHDGTLKATSPGLGLGTTFTMVLPLCRRSTTTDEDDSMDFKKRKFSLRPLPVTSSLKLLVVDDSVSNRKLLGRLLENAGHVCDFAENGQEAVDIVREKMEAGEQYDTILLDFEMPVLNGPSAAKEIRRTGSDVFIVGVTGNMLSDDVSFFISCGANDVLGKPFKMSNLEKVWRENGVLMDGLQSNRTIANGKEMQTDSDVIAMEPARDGDTGRNMSIVSEKDDENKGGTRNSVLYV